MSSILLKKDRDGKKAGEVISVPFAIGKTLIASGVGVYPDSAGENEEQKAPGATAPGGEVKTPEPKPDDPLKPTFPPQPTPPGGHEKQKQK